MDSKNYNLACVVTNYGMGSKIAKHLKNYGVKGTYIMIGKGSVDAKILAFLGISDIRKEILCMLVPEKYTSDMLQFLVKEYNFDKPNHGIAFVKPILEMVDIKEKTSLEIEEIQSGGDFMYQVITAIVEKGKAEDVINMAKLGGATGATIINARGAGEKETSRVFSIEIEPEKEIVMIISKTEMTKKIVDSIKNGLDEKGILLVQDVKYVYGLYE
ncbi:P-II family nitrogen regulator [Soehngenia saccharolytica]|nr:P-II family nitrogen regulator [Soehngenia saccharolytica]